MSSEARNRRTTRGPSTQTAAASGVIAAYDGVDVANPIAASGGRSSAAASAAIVAPSITTDVPNTMLVAFYGVATNAAITQATGMVERAEVVSSGRLKMTSAMADQLLAAGWELGRAAGHLVEGGEQHRPPDRAAAGPVTPEFRRRRSVRPGGALLMPGADSGGLATQAHNAHMGTSVRLAGIGLAVVVSLLVAALVAVTPARAGVIVCGLQATVGGGSATELGVGEEVLIEGFDFPPGDVEISYSSDGVFLRSVTVAADATGSFETSVVPVTGEEGLWSVEAVGIDEICTATTGFLVLAGPTPAPTPSPTPIPTPVPAASALPNVALDAGNGSGSPPWLVLLGVALFVSAGCLRLVAVRRDR